MKLEVYCAMCGKEKSIPVDTVRIDRSITLQEIIQASGWIVQVNSSYFDIYCSKKCAV